MYRRRVLALAASSFAMGGCLQSSSPIDRIEDGRVRWRFPIGHRAPTPAVDEGSVYAVETTSGVHAFDADDGTRRWHRSNPRSAWFGPAVGDGTLFAVGSEDLVACNAANGGEHWRYTWPDKAWMEASPVVSENAVFASISSSPTSHSGSQFPEDLWAFDRRDGNLLWKRDLSGPDQPNTWGVFSGQPVLHDGTLYIQTRGGTVAALDPSDGSERWRVQFDGNSDVGGPALVTEQDTIVVLLETHSDDPGRALVALAMSDGRERWRVDGIQTAPLSDGSTVYGGEIADIGGESTVYALSTADGSDQWQFTKPGRLKTWTSLSVGDGTLFASFTERTGQGEIKDDVSTLYAVGMDGTEQWRFERSCEGFSGAVVSEETIYVTGRSGDETLYALTLEA